MVSSVEIYPDKAALVARAAELTAAQLRAAIATRGQARLALAGGSTPKPIYAALAQLELPWSQLHIFWGDERYVPADHADSNQRMARAAWLDQVPIPAANLHPMPTSAGDPAADAAQHEAELRAHFQVAAGSVPQFDLILLGLGDDGHTASLFPHTEVLAERDRLVAVGSKDGQPRLTFTVPLLNQARGVIFLVSGANKQDALQAVLAEQGDANQYPARLVQPQGELWWLLDAAAAAKVEQVN
ncbi:MAG: 6-phosphogluconolactonase [Spirulinaceae cyanobacterium RM2_2_10]|nr:6-phosphogluconolactonase [Spirulinaceae cyanobacterium SM2_1_0]NJO21144.1 6-phosphogluconolactonase [Spirulinaceae cyanobacterium RM2_2_10]